MKAWWCVIGIIPILEALKVTTISYNCPDVCLCDSRITACQFTGLTDLPKNLNPKIISLDLSYNVIASVPAGLKNLVNLKYLNLSHNLISTLSHSDFAGLVKLERLDLSFNHFQDWKDIHGNALATLYKLEFLDISSNQLRIMPQHSNYFPMTSLKILKLNNCSFKSFPVDNLNHVVNLTEVHLTDNPVASLTSKFTLKKLKYIDLSNCLLEYIDEDVFQNATELEILNLPNNHLLRNFSCKSDSLISLDLRNSNIENTPGGNMRSLRSLHLQENVIKTLSTGSFLNYPNLLFLNLSVNAITTIDDNAFKGLDEVQIMDLSYNKLAVITERLFLPTIGLIDLNLSHNYISSLDQITSASITKLDASYCEIYTVNKYTLSRLIKLTKLSLSRNFISSLPDEWEASSVRLLDLSGCRIRSIGNHTFKQMQYLIEIDLSDNLFSYMAPSFFPPHIRFIKLSDNQWMCECTKIKPMYDYLKDRIYGIDNLICDAPEKVQGLSWYSACGRIWKTSSKKEQMYWYAIAIVTSITFLLLVLLGLRKLHNLKEKRDRETEERRRQQERDAREALERMRRMQQEYLEEESRNAPDPRHVEGPPAYTEALLMPRIDSAHNSLHGSMHSLASRGSLRGSSSDINKKGKIRRKRRKRSESAERIRQSRITVEESDTTDQERVNRAPLESDF